VGTSKFQNDTHREFVAYQMKLYSLNRQFYKLYIYFIWLKLNRFEDI